jgi:hypothetical protein
MTRANFTSECGNRRPKPKKVTETPTSTDIAENSWGCVINEQQRWSISKGFCALFFLVVFSKNGSFLTSTLFDARSFHIAQSVVVVHSIGLDICLTSHRQFPCSDVILYSTVCASLACSCLVGFHRWHLLFSLLMASLSRWTTAQWPAQNRQYSA